MVVVRAILSHARNHLLIQQMIESVLFSIPQSKGVTTRTHKNKTSMAYSVSQSDLVPMLAKCLLRHGSLAAVENYPEQVRNQGGDATVCAEFMALHEIRRTSNPEELIRAAYEKAIQAATGALRDADVKSSKEVTPVVRQAKRPVWLIPLVAWLIIAGLSIWLEDEGTSPILLASIVASAAYLLGVVIAIRRNKEREQDAHDNPDQAALFR